MATRQVVVIEGEENGTRITFHTTAPLCNRGIHDEERVFRSWPDFWNNMSAETVQELIPGFDDEMDSDADRQLIAAIANIPGVLVIKLSALKLTVEMAFAFAYTQTEWERIFNAILDAIGKLKFSPEDTEIRLFNKELQTSDLIA